MTVEVAALLSNQFRWFCSSAVPVAFFIRRPPLPKCQPAHRRPCSNWGERRFPWSLSSSINLPRHPDAPTSTGTTHRAARCAVQAARRERALPWRKRKTNVPSARRAIKNSCVSALATTHRLRSIAVPRLSHAADLHKASCAGNLASRRVFSHERSSKDSPGKTRAPTASARRSVTLGPPINKTEAQRRARSAKPTRVTRVTRVAQAHATPPSSRAFKTSNSIRSHGLLNRHRNGNHNPPRTSGIAMRVTTARQINSKLGATDRRSQGAGPSNHRATRPLRRTQREAAAPATEMMTTMTISTTPQWPNPAACACQNA